MRRRAPEGAAACETGRSALGKGSLRDSADPLFLLLREGRIEDFNRRRLEGASLHGAHISGTYFPVELAADEIDLSVRVGTRLRYRPR